MNYRLLGAIVVFLAVWAALLLLFNAVVGPPPQEASALWFIWRAVGAMCLSASAVELTFFLTWRWQTWRGFSADGGVPLRLSAADRHLLASDPPGLALLMPAHNEASTPQDRAALVERICDILLKTPAYSTFFLLADSPASQRDNEMSVIRQVRSRLRALGYARHENRLVLEEYRDKPPDWRHKTGSLLCWIQRHGADYPYMYILDADSWLADEDPARPQTCQVVERMLVAMLRDPNLALLQAAMHVKNHQTPWGWVQAVNAKVGSVYYLPVFAYLYGRATPCYGHNCMLRVSDFAQHARNTLHYTSHDHIDACDLAAAGRGCVLSDAVLTYEETEDSLLMWLKRECRWSRGNGQWLMYMLLKRGLPLSPRVFLTLGALQYIWALLAGLFFIGAVAMGEGDYGVMAANAGGARFPLLLGFVIFVLSVPKLLASSSLRDFAGSMAISFLLSPALMLYQGLAFVLGAFGTRWVPRGSRSGAFDRQHLWQVAQAMLPISVLGIILWPLAGDGPVSVWGERFMHTMIILMITSPLTAVLVSWPWRQQRPSLAMRAG